MACGRGRRIFVGFEERADAALELGLCRLHRVVVGDLEPACDDVAQQAVGLTARLWMGATAEEIERLRARLQRRFELAAQPALADPRPRRSP